MTDAPKPEPNESTLDWVCNASEQEIAIALDSAHAELAAVKKQNARYETIANPARVAVEAMAERDSAREAHDHERVERTRLQLAGEDLQAQLDEAREALAKAERDNMCDACAGTGKPESGLHCQCLGSGKMSVAAETLCVVAHQQRERAESAERERDEVWEALKLESRNVRVITQERERETRIRLQVSEERDRLAAENARMERRLVDASKDLVHLTAKVQAHFDENARLRKALEEIAGHCERRVHSPPVRWIFDVARSALDVGKDPIYP
jgi:hypothetical protein